MSKVNPKAMGGGASRPALTPEDFAGKSQAVLTISAVETDVKIPDTSRPGGFRLVAVLSFEEYQGDDDRALYLNKTQAEHLVAKFGDESDDWVGERVPLEVVKVNNPKTGKPHRKVYVADPGDTWDAILDAAKPRRAPTAKARKRR
jgi:hypothetical protein